MFVVELQFSDDFNFYKSALGEAQSTDAGACGLCGEVLAVNSVECSKIVDIMQEACGLDYLCKVRTSLCKKP